MPVHIPFRRSAAAAALVAATLTACGTQQGGEVRSAASAAASSASPQPSFSPRPLCARSDRTPEEIPASSAPAPDEGGDRQEAGQGHPDMPPNYADNHAYRMAGKLTEEARARGEASAELIRGELEEAMREGDLSDERLKKALKNLGCGEEHGVYVGHGFYSVHTGNACVSGNASQDGITSNVHGAYIEPQPGTGPCVRNQGGH
ncbi:hypothetical protein [Streptomyces sp. WZ.A104]|uniref:hypothetical protein n=1 Tax=Streptomyces sp. WZ.A104 TaxID=2023771 RepID=UPI00211C0F89|nr:hypothetical protein [Streptomyces sp. WZ.A104]